MADIFTTVSAFSKTKKKAIGSKEKEKKEKEKNKGSVIIEPTAAMINQVGDMLVAGETDLHEIRKAVKDGSGKRLTREQMEDVILVCKNVGIAENDPTNYKVEDEGRTLVYIGETITPEV